MPASGILAVFGEMPAMEVCDSMKGWMYLLHGEHLWLLWQMEGLAGLVTGDWGGRRCGCEPGIGLYTMPIWIPLWYIRGNRWKQVTLWGRWEIREMRGPHHLTCILEFIAGVP